MNRLQVYPLVKDVGYSPDQVARTAQRIAYGVYRITHAGQQVGEETWNLLALVTGGFRITTEINLKWPLHNRQRAVLDVDDRWNVHGLWVQLDIAGSRRKAAYIPNGNRINIDITDLPVIDDGQRDGKLHMGRHLSLSGARPYRLGASPNMTTRENGARRQLMFEPTTHVDFASAMFNYVVLKRLSLRPGTEASFSSVVVTLPSLEPLNIRQIYRYDADELPDFDPTQAPLRRYTISEVGAPDLATTFWSDNHDVVHKQELMLNGVLHGCEIINYRWLA